MPRQPKLNEVKVVVPSVDLRRQMTGERHLELDVIRHQLELFLE